ncbi:MAG TPA: hypothetical protein VGL77_10475 [Armatimonadota bacterium]|jgi:hypothetical protein
MKASTVSIILIGLVLGIATLVWVSTTPPQPHGQVSEVIFCLDRSGSARNLLPSYVMSTARTMSLLDERKARVTCYRLDRGCAEFYAGAPLHSREATTEMLVKYLHDLPAENTCPAYFWREMARRYGKTTRPAIILCYTDGDNDDASPEALRTMRQAVGILGGNPNIQVVIVGPLPENRAGLRTVFSPLGERFSIISLEQSAMHALDTIYR